MMARAKSIELQAEPLPPGGLESEAFLAVNPIAKIPVLLLDDGSALPESEVILRYLESRFPDPATVPPHAVGKARIDLACRIIDLYVMAPVIRLFPELAPERRNARTVSEEVARWNEGLAILSKVLATPLPPTPAGLSMADCMLAPALHLSTRIAAMLELDSDPITAHPVLVDYYRSLVGDSIAGPVLEALTLAQGEKDAQHGLPDLTRHHRRLAGLPY